MNKFQQARRSFMGHRGSIDCSSRDLGVYCTLLSQLYEASALSYRLADTASPYAELVAQLKLIDEQLANSTAQRLGGAL